MASMERYVGKGRVHALGSRATLTRFRTLERVTAVLSWLICSQGFQKGVCNGGHLHQGAHPQ